MNSITTHILNLDTGRPATGVAVTLYREGEALATAVTDGDGRVSRWSAVFALDAGEYCLSFDVAGWFAATGQESFYSGVDIRFFVTDSKEHYHVPLLLNRYGYSTYRGS